MCHRCEDQGIDHCDLHGHSMEFGDGQPDDECTRCGKPGDQIAGELAEAQDREDRQLAELRKAGVFL
jgi:hypothetical protein